MASDRMFVARTVLTRHPRRYQDVFGDLPDLSDPSRFPLHASPAVPGMPFEAWQRMSEGDRAIVQGVYVRALKAIAAYERRLLPQESAFDRFVDQVASGDPEPSALAGPQQEGLRLFLRSGCTDCHHGPWFSDRAFHNLGLPFQGPFDGGRSIGAAQVLESEFNCRSTASDTRDCPELDHLDPSFPDFQQAFKTPSLRNVAVTAPYMHHGQLGDLRAVVDFYAELPGDAAVNHRELTLKPRNLSPVERDAIVAFLTSLTGDPWPEALVTPLEPR
jgi:cytochrome c peroxidase